MKSKYLTRLKELHVQHFRKNHPDFPENAIPIPAYSLANTNALTKAVEAYIALHGGRVYRVNVQGQFDSKTGQWRHSGGHKGLPDLMGMGPGGQFLGVEIKFGRDTLSKDQIKVHDQIGAAGGAVFVCRDFDLFCEWFHCYFRV